MSESTLETKEHRREIANRIVEEFCKRPPRLFLSMRLKGQFTWPHEFTKLNLFDRDWLLWPNTKWDRPGIIIHCPSGDGTAEGKLAMRFLSALAWVQGKRIEDEGFWLVGTNVNPCFRDEPLPDSPFPRGHGLLIDEHDYLPFPKDEKAQIALALYREALCIDETAYRFLSFYKILNVRIQDGKGQIAWINQNLAYIKDHSAKEQIEKLQQQQSDVGNYLHVSGRCAVAHAWGDPIVNPDNPEDKRRLSADLPVIKALSELMIENDFGIKSGMTVYREHFYELAGFKEALGDDLVQLISEGYDLNAEGEEVVALIEQRLPTLSIQLRGEPELPYENLTPEVQHYEKGRTVIKCTSQDGLTDVYLGLNFKKERLEFDPQNSFISWDNGSANAARLAALENTFMANLYGNGVLEVWAEGKLLGRKDPFLPANIDMSATLRNFRKAAERYKLLCTMRTLGLGQSSLRKISLRKLLGSTNLSRNYFAGQED